MKEDRLVFFGTDAFSVPTLIQLLAEDAPVVGVVTKPDSKVGRGRELTMPAVKRLALAKNIPVLQPTSLKDALTDIQALKPTAGIVVAYGKIIPKPVIEVFPKGLINCHASLLPLYRGASPIEATILAGDAQTGITLMQIEPGLDTGPTYAVSVLQLTGRETRLDLYELLAEKGAQLLASKLPGILDGTILPVPQDNARASTVSLIAKSDGDLDWSDSAEELDRQVRAYLGWPGSRATLGGADVIITKAHPSPLSGKPGVAYKSPTSDLAVYAGTGSLIIEALKPAGKREMTGVQFLAGHPLK